MEPRVVLRRVVRIPPGDVDADLLVVSGGGFGAEFRIEGDAVGVGPVEAVFRLDDGGIRSAAGGEAETFWVFEL